MATYTGIAIISFILGMFTGVIFAQLFFRYKVKFDAQSAVIAVICFGFIISLLYEVVNQSYSTNPLLYGLMGSVVGLLFRGTIKNDKTNG